MPIIEKKPDGIILMVGTKEPRTFVRIIRTEKTDLGKNNWS